MKRFRPLILAAAIALAGLLAYGLWTLPKPQNADAEGFSSARVANDIKVISRDRKSVV